jgi:GNAT superfamily N-acetyltransferase
MPTIVPFEEHHGPGVLALISAVFAEYGLTFDPAGYDADLTRVTAAYTEAGGAFWVLDAAGRVAGTVAVVPLSPPAQVEIKRVYLEAARRGQGWGRALVEEALAWTAARGQRRVRLWSDVKFTRSHALYERLGFVRTGVRACGDIDQSREYGFEKLLSALATTPR